MEAATFLESTLSEALKRGLITFQQYLEMYWRLFERDDF